MPNITKKIVAIAMTLSVSALLVGPGVAQAVTADELQAQIDALMAQLATLQAQLAGLGGGGVAVSCTFTRALYPGVSGADVLCLQQYLNSSGNTLAASGPGSSGNETQYYGPLTQGAVQSWQNANGVVYGAYGGYFGPISQAKYNQLAAAVPPPAEEEEEEEEEVVEGLTCEGSEEGSILGSLYATPPDNAEVYIKTTGTGVVGVAVKATGSDVKVTRFDSTFNKRPWLYIKNLTITDGTTSKTFAVTEDTTTEVVVGSNYVFRAEGLNFLIPKGTISVFTVQLDGADNLPSGTTSQAVTITIGANAMRGTDCASISQYAPTAALTARTFTAKSGDTANLELTAHADNPKARNVEVEATAKTTGLTVAKLRLKATNNDSILRGITFTDATASGTLDVVSLYDGDTLLSSTSSITTGGSILYDINLTIPKDTTKVLTIKASIKKAQANYIASATSTNASSTVTIVAAAGVTGIDAEDATTFAAATVSGSNVVPGDTYFYKKAPTLVLSTASITSVAVATGTLTYNGKADARIKVNLTATGGDIYIASTTANTTVASSSIYGSSTIVQSITSNAVESSAGNWVVRSGETKWFEIYAQLTRVGADGRPLDLSLYVFVPELKWQTTDALSDGAFIRQTWALSDLKTGSIVLEYVR